MILVLLIPALLTGVVICFVYWQAPVASIRRAVPRHADYSGARMVRLEDIPGMLVLALLLHEDDLFFEHRGVNLREVRQRIRAWCWGGQRLRGGSSISQQLVRGLYFNQRRSWMRKLLELIYTIKLERNFSKQEILALYLNYTRWGERIFGVRAAANFYLSSEPQNLSLVECMLLCGLIPDPGRQQYSLVYGYGSARYQLTTALNKFTEFFRIVVRAFGAEGLERLEQLDWNEVKRALLDYGRTNYLPLAPELEHAIAFQALRAVSRLQQRLYSLHPQSHRVCRSIAYRAAPEAAALVSVISGWSAEAQRAGPAEVVEWDAALKLAARHGVSLGVDRMRLLFGSQLPPEIERDIHLTRVASAARALRIGQLLQRIETALSAAAIPLLVLKGPAFAVAYYGDIGARPFRDLDLLVDPRSLAQTLATLAKLGINPESEPDAVARHIAVRYEGSLKLRWAAEDLQIDLHVALMPRHFPQLGRFSALYAASVQLSVPDLGLNFRALNPEDDLLFMTLHGLKHCWARAAWIEDLTRLLSSAKLEYDRVLQRAADCGVEEALVTALVLAAQIGGAELADSFDRRTQANSGATRTGLLFARDCFVQRSGFSAALTNLTRQVRCLDRFGARARLVWGRIFTPTTLDTGHLPRWMEAIGFCYIGRQYRLLKGLVRLNTATASRNS